MSMPNIHFGSPVIFFDSHPDQQPNYVTSYWHSFRDHLMIAWTGDVPKPLHPGTLRLVWWTTDGTRGFRDFELHQSELIKSLWDEMLDIEDVARALVTGYSGQNPWMFSYGDNPWLTKEQKQKIKKKNQDQIWAKRSANRLPSKPKELKFVDGVQEKEQILQHIDEVILSDEQAEQESLLGKGKMEV